MNIAFIIYDYNYHGGAQKTATIAQHLQSQGHSVDIIVIRCRGGDNEKKKRPKHFSNILDLNATGFFNGIFRLIKIFRNSRHDVYISIGPYSNFSTGLAKFLCRGKFPLIGSENFAKSPLIGNYPKLYFRLLLPLFWLSYNQLNGLVFVTDRLRLEFLNKNSWHPSRCITIYNPVKFSKKNFKQNKKKYNTSGLTFLGVGILEQRKRFDLLIRAFSKVANNKDKLLIAGEGSLGNELKKLVNQLGLEQQVNFLGYNSDIQSLMKKSDILVHTSNSEAFGMVLAEGLATGMQVVSTNSFSGPAEILGNGRYGFLSEVDNLDSIIEALKLAISSPKSQEIIFEGVLKFSVNSIADQYVNFISAVIANNGHLNEDL